MSISLLVFSLLSFLGVASGAVLLLSDLGLFEIASPLMLWFIFLLFSVLGPSGIMMATQRPGRLLATLGLVFTALGLTAIMMVFVSALGVASLHLPMLELLFIALLTLTGGGSLFAAGRAAASAGRVQ